MKIIVVGAGGTIGSAVAEALTQSHDVVRAARSTGSVSVDIERPESIKKMFAQVGDVDAVICAAGSAKFGDLTALTDEEVALSVRSKLMGQVNLVRYGAPHVSSCIAITSGVLGRHPMPGSSVLSMVNAGLEAFVRAAALDLGGSPRVNAISPGWVKETMDRLGMDSTPGMPAAQVALGYVEAIESKRDGEVIFPADLV